MFHFTRLSYRLSWKFDSNLTSARQPFYFRLAAALRRVRNVNNAECEHASLPHRAINRLAGEVGVFSWNCGRLRWNKSHAFCVFFDLHRSPLHVCLLFSNRHRQVLSSKKIRSPVRVTQQSHATLNILYLGRSWVKKSEKNHRVSS